jgi:hypothetical protein
MRLEFLATTGELLAARIPDPNSLSVLGIRSPERLPPVEAPDFTPPVFIAASRKLAASTVTVSPNDAVALLRQAWADLKPKLGSNPFNAISSATTSTSRSPLPAGSPPSLRQRLGPAPHTFGPTTCHSPVPP